MLLDGLDWVEDKSLTLIPRYVHCKTIACMIRQSDMGTLYNFKVRARLTRHALCSINNHKANPSRLIIARA